MRPFFPDNPAVWFLLAQNVPPGDRGARQGWHSARYECKGWSCRSSPLRAAQEIFIETLFWPAMSPNPSQPLKELWYGPPESITKLQQVLVLCHGDDDDASPVVDNLCMGLQASKFAFAVLDLALTGGWPSLSGFQTLVIATERIWEVDFERLERLREHVFGGGGLVVAYRCWCEPLADVLGIPGSGRGPGTHMTEGLSFDAEIFPGLGGLELTQRDWQVDHSRLEVDAEQLPEGATILASDGWRRPIAWQHGFGDGRVIVWNTNVMFSRVLRGMLVQSVLSASPSSVCAISGIGMVHVDDFPTSLSDAVLQPVCRETPGQSWNEFFFDAWHTDMMALKRRYRLRYTWYVVMNYHDDANRPEHAEKADLSASGREVLEDRFSRVRHNEPDDEYGFHGYNHVPLTADGWPDLPTLRYKLGLARDLWDSSVPAPLPSSWVPANNWYEAERVRVLASAFPEITDICGLNLIGDPDLGEYREFGPEPWEPSLNCLPRNTFGYVLEPRLRLMMLSQLAATGSWTHFVHPDDIYDIPNEGGSSGYYRNADERLWKTTNAAGLPGLFTELENWLGEVEQGFPWLEYMTTSEAAARMDEFNARTVNVLHADGSVEIHADAPGLYYLRIPAHQTVELGQGAEVVDRRDVIDGHLLVVRCDAGRTNIRVIDSPLNEIADADLIQSH
ncbi:DUF2194 domain-containing protein [Tepidamorphus sp. 3E244]|uniref:DUF2194 domain-containing protein n=1 Tax=Tepidamorphus sp. 3E244 TaxID=3385498 RepID=UPI0038FC7053